MSKAKIIGYAFGAGVVASLLVLFVGLGVFGSQWAFWQEWQGRIVGIASTIAGVAGVILGLWIASRSERRHQEREVLR